MRNKQKQMRQNELRAILILLITATTAWKFAAYILTPRKHRMVQKSRTKFHFSSRCINNTLYFKRVARNRTITKKLVALYLKIAKIMIVRLYVMQRRVKD